MDSPLPPLLQATSGAIGSAVGNALVFPLDLATTRMQHARRKISLLRTLHSLTRRRGLSALYSGLPADTLSTLLSSFTYFFLYTILRRIFLHTRTRSRSRSLPRPPSSATRGRGAHRSSPAGIGGMRGPAHEALGVSISPLIDAVEEVVIGVGAGVISKALTLPISAVCVRQQLGHEDDHEGSDETKPKPLSLFDTLRTIHAESGLVSLFPGLAPTIPLALLPSISLYVHTALLRLLVPARRRAHPPVSLTFLLGAVSNALATGLLYPLILVKSLEQAGAGGRGKGKGKEKEKESENEREKECQGGLKGMVQRMKEIVESDGVPGLYKGVEGQIVKGFVQQGVMMVVKQRVEEAVVTASFVFCKRDQVF